MSMLLQLWRLLDTRQRRAGTRRVPSGSASAPLPVQTFIRSSYVQQKVPQAAFAIHEYSRQLQAVIRCPRHTRQDRDCRRVAGAPHQLDGIGGEVPERIGRSEEHTSELQSP